MRILYLIQWFAPEPAVLKGLAFVRALEQAGHDVTVATGTPNYPGGKIYQGYKYRFLHKEIIEGVRIERLPLYPSHNKSTIGRALNYLSFFVSALIYGLLRGQRFDLVYVYHPPITVGLAAALFGIVKKLNFVMEIQDLWPDTIAESQMKGTRIIARLMNGVCNYVYGKASAIIVQSGALKQILTERGVPSGKLKVILNWADQAALGPYVENVDDVLDPRKFNIVYGGNLGRMQALHKVVMAAKLAAQTNEDLEVLFIGEGLESNSLKHLVAAENVTNVRFLPRMSIDRVAAISNRADALLVHLANLPLFTTIVPTKTQFYLAQGRPIIGGLIGEGREILERSGAAVLAEPEDVHSLCRAMVEISGFSKDRLDEMGRSGKIFYDQFLSFERGIEATLKVINEVNAVDRTQIAQS